MTEEDGAGVVGHAFVRKESGLTVADLRVLLAATETAGLPDSAELRVRTSWNMSKHGARVVKIIAVVPE